MSKRVLYGVMDWGLGHATRSVPVIKEFIQQGASLTIASSGNALYYLKKVFPELEILELPNLEIKYPRNEKPGNWLFIAKGVINYGKLKKYYASCQKHIQEGRANYDLMVSDGHYGVWHSDCKNVLLTHQLNLQSTYFKESLNKAHQAFLEPFSEFWVPDDSNRTLSGELSEYSGKKDLRFIGPLSALSQSSHSEKSQHILCQLSGPEPQRSLFQKLLESQVPHLPEYQFSIVLGKSGHQFGVKNVSNVTVYDLALPEVLARLLAQSEVVVARSGYSSIMDLHLLNKRAVLVPTPGQGEQEYLAKYHHNKHGFWSVNQLGFSLTSAIDNALKLSKSSIKNNGRTLEGLIKKVLI